MRLAGVLGFIAVALGAFGAHGLKDTLSTEMLEIWKTGVLYHLVHAVFLGFAHPWKWATRLAVAGIALFSGSLYGYALMEAKPLVFITPIGGLCFLAAWASLVITKREAA